MFETTHWSAETWRTEKRTAKRVQYGDRFVRLRRCLRRLKMESDQFRAEAARQIRISGVISHCEQAHLNKLEEFKSRSHSKSFKVIQTSMAVSQSLEPYFNFFNWNFERLNDGARATRFAAGAVAFMLFAQFGRKAVLTNRMCGVWRQNIVARSRVSSRESSDELIPSGKSRPTRST